MNGSSHSKDIGYVAMQCISLLSPLFHQDDDVDNRIDINTFQFDILFIC